MPADKGLYTARFLAFSTVSLGFMKIPNEISEWLREKVEGHRWSGVIEARTVTHEWTLRTGGRIMRAGLTASIIPAEAFSVSFPTDEAAAAFVPAVRNGMFSILLGHNYSPILNCAVSFESFSIHELESSYAAFFRVASETTQRLLGLCEGYPHNVAW